MESLFIQIKYKSQFPKKLTLITGFVVQGHIIMFLCMYVFFLLLI